jgi:hypothetical protein
VRKIASAIKTFYLVELFDTTADGIVEWESNGSAFRPSHR